MSVRTILLAAAACAVAAPAFAATSKHHMMHHHMMATHTTMMHHGHMMGHMAHGSTAGADNSADELNAKSLMNAQGGGMAAPMTPAPAPMPAKGGT